MITQRMMLGSGAAETDTWQFMVDTEATTQGEKTTGIPVNLYGQTSIINVDWGDGTTSSLSASDYTETDNRASVHEYASAGEYTVTLSCSDWENTYLLGVAAASNISGDNINDKLSCLYWFRRTLVAFLSPFPNVAGSKCYTGLISDTLSDYPYFPYFFYLANHVAELPSDFLSLHTERTTLQSLFYGMGGLTSVPEGLFSRNAKVLSFSGIFNNCSSLSVVPSNLFTANTKVTIFDSCFKGCTSLGDFTLYITSPDVSSVSSFVTAKAGANRVVYVPSGSTTETTFNAKASSLGLTIIGE